MAGSTRVPSEPAIPSMDHRGQSANRDSAV
jgi:hypothetical protein